MGKAKSKTPKYASQCSSDPHGRSGSGKTQWVQELVLAAPPTLLRDAEAETKAQVSLVLSAASRTGERLWIN